MGISPKVDEDRIRRLVARQGFMLEKSRRRDPRAPDFGRFRIVDPHTNSVAAGGQPWDYSLSLDEAEAWALEGEPPVSEWEQVAQIAGGWGGLWDALGKPEFGPDPVRVLRDRDGRILAVRIDRSDRVS
jgi:hypothetical protein